MCKGKRSNYQLLLYPEDIHVYSIDESFIDATRYLKMYNKTPKEFAKFLIDEIAKRKYIPATAGIGTNLYLAKIALDITAKHVSDHIGYLDEEIYKKTLWNHRPITDFWMIAGGTSRRLAKRCIYDMEGVANYPQELLYKEFGINAELLIDHAWGRESCTMEDIKSYKSKSKSVSNSQILMEDYPYEKAKVVMREMVQTICYEMMRRHVITNSVGIFVGHSKEVIPATGGSVKMSETTALFSIIAPYVDTIFDKTTVKNVPIRRLGISCSVCDEGAVDLIDIAE